MKFNTTAKAIADKFSADGSTAAFFQHILDRNKVHLTGPRTKKDIAGVMMTYHNKVTSMFKDGVKDAGDIESLCNALFIDPATLPDFADANSVCAFLETYENVKRVDRERSAQFMRGFEGWAYSNSSIVLTDDDLSAFVTRSR